MDVIRWLNDIIYLVECGMIMADVEVGILSYKQQSYNWSVNQTV